jgi:ubiquinone/menaquinone biosynthesis C-methylase UbiE
MGSIEYHLREMAIALDEGDERRILPEVRDGEKIILDIGCGIGQSLIALDRADLTRIGIDIDEDAIRYGIAHYGDRIQFIHASAHRIPLPSRTFDLVYSRVSLPYTNIPRAIKEIRRVLRKGGRVWMTLHDRSMAARYMREAIRTRNVKRLVHVAYILANGFLLKHLGRVVPFITGRYESWQDPAAMEALLVRHGFTVNVQKVGRHTVIEGCLA